jgi:DNA-binding NarL/FixJ family response regulator
MRLLLADDHNLVRDALKNYIERLEPDAAVLTAADFTEVMDIIATDERLDLVILDLKMPGMRGCASIEDVHAVRPKLPVAIMSGSAQPQDVTGALAHGGRGFIPKTLAGAALVSAIRLIIAGEVFVPPSMFGYGSASAAASNDHGVALPASEAPALTQREREVLGHLSRGYANKEIARFLDLQEVTIKLHVRGICRKLGAKNRTQAVTRAMDVGLVR